MARQQREHDQEHREAIRKTWDILDQAEKHIAQARRDIPNDQEAWERYIEAERQDVEWRRNGSLARAIGNPLPGESVAELESLAQKDQLRAEQGLVELRSGDRVWYKHLDELLPKDRIHRTEAEMARIDWLQARMEQRQ
jgi:hypothetical protein